MSLAMIIGLAALGLTTGVLSGCFGIGGGVLIAPSLVLLFGFTQKLATGTSLALLLPPIGILAVMEYYKKGHVDAYTACVIGITMVLGMWIGSRLAIKANETYLKIGFGCLLLAIGASMIYSALYAKETLQTFVENP